MEKLNRATVLLLCVLIVMFVNFPLISRVVAEGMSGDDLFRFVWDDSLGVYPFFGGYYIVSDQVFPLNVYAVSLPNVGNYRASNHSAVVEGVRQATIIYPLGGEVKELSVPLWSDLYMKLNVSISFHLVDDWETYKTLVESGNDTIIVNTHDEYLPVPEGYGKEEWTDKIADFMLNHRGTWVHVGGYPLYRIWHQNGTKEEWGEQGFKHLMSHIGKGNITCYSPTEWNPQNSATLSMWASQNLGINWLWMYTNNITLSLADFEYSNQGYPIKYWDFKDQNICDIYSYGDYKPGAIIHFSQNSSVFNFGIYVHMSPWQFYNIGGHELPSEASMGFISTAAAIFGEFSYATSKLYGRTGNSASEAIQEAEKEGRTVGLTEAKSLFQNALDAFASGNYKLSVAHANQAKLTAETATAPSTLPQTIALIAIVATSVSVGAYYKLNNKKNKRKVLECTERKQQ